MSKQIILSSNKVSIVDDEDFENLTRYKWSAKPDKGNWYAMRKDGAGRTIYMHHQISGDNSIDHMNGNGLDNRRENLRHANNQQNSFNSRIRIDNTTGYKGVWLVGFKWRACISINRKRKHLGYFETAEDAAKAYDKAARELFRDFAALNFPNSEERSALVD